MFSDLAPISESGYRAQINADPAIRQGVQYLNDGRSYINELMPSLNLISQTDGTGIGSGKIVKGKIVEGLTPTATAPPTSPAPSLTPSTTTAQSSSTTTTTTTTTTPQQQIIDIGPLMAEYQSISNTLNDTMTQLNVNADGGIAPNDDNIPSINSSVGQARSIILGGVKHIRNNLDSVYNKISSITNNNIRITNNEYENIMNELYDIKAKIIHNYQELNRYEKSIDYISPVAGAEETSTLSTQRYYVYILWFIITVIVLYITISNLISPSSSTWSLAVSLIIIIGLFAFLVYNNIGTWYTKVDDDIRSIQLPSFNNVFNFDPLVSIKYTS